MAIPLQPASWMRSRPENESRGERSARGPKARCILLSNGETGLSQAAIDADASASPVVRPAEIWQNFIDGRLRFQVAGRTRLRQYIVARTRAGTDGWSGGGLSPAETTIVARVFCGDAQKVVAAELGIACSTASKWFTRALEKLNLGRTAVPLALVTAAQSWALDRTPANDTRSGLFDYDGCSLFFLSVSRPTMFSAASLTPSEREIARWFVEGDSRRDIAVRRSTSMQTVASQLGAIFSKLGQRGRYPLIRHAADRGWLD